MRPTSSLLQGWARNAIVLCAASRHGTAAWSAGQSLGGAAGPGENQYQCTGLVTLPTRTVFCACMTKAAKGWLRATRQCAASVAGGVHPRKHQSRSTGERPGACARRVHCSYDCIILQHICGPHLQKCSNTHIHVHTHTHISISAQAVACSHNYNYMH